MAKKKVIEKEEAVAEEVSAPIKQEAKVVAKKDSPDDLISVQIPVSIKIKRQIYDPGLHRVPRHVVATIREMVDKKTRADVSMFTGKSFLVDRVAGGALVVKEVKSLK